MLKQRIINLNPDEVLIIKAPHQPEERVELRLITDEMEKFHVFVTSRPFAVLHKDKTPDQMRHILATHGKETFPELMDSRTRQENS